MATLPLHFFERFNLIAPNTSALISPAGETLVFEGADMGMDNQGNIDSNGVNDLFETTFYSNDSVACITRAADGSQANGASSQPAYSAGGTLLAFASFASNFSAKDSSPNQDVYIRGFGGLQPVSVGWQNTQSNGDSSHPTLSANGCIAFESTSSNLIASDINRQSDIFFKDYNLDETLRLVSCNAQGEQANGASTHALLSGNGRFVAFESEASNLLANDTNGKRDVFVKDMQSGNVERINLSASGQQDFGDARLESFSADGRYVVFSSTDAQLVGGDTNQARDIFIKDRSTGQLQRVSVDTDGQQGNGDSYHAQLSSGGMYLSFTSNANNLTGASDSNADGSPHTAVLVKNLQTGVLMRLHPATLSENGQSYTVDSDRGGMSADASHLIYSYQMKAADGSLYKSSAFAPWLLLDDPDAWNSNRITGTAADDQLHGSILHNTIDGAGGCDTMVYNHPRSEYSIYTYGGSTENVSVYGNGHGDTLHNVERLAFSDVHIALDRDGAAGQTFCIYQAAFNRRPDQGGLSFWMYALDQGASLESVAQTFMQSGEFIALYGAQPSSSQLLEKLYQNVMHRPPEPEGYAYWLGLLEQHQVTPAQVVTSFASSWENQMKIGLTGIFSEGVEYIPFA